MSEVVYPLKLPVVSSLPSASTYANRFIFYDGKPYYSDGTDWIDMTNANTVDNYHASQTPATNTIIVSGSNGLIANGWLANSIRGFENPIDTVAYYNQTGNDYLLQVGEVAKITFSSTQSVPLRIATQSDTEYNMWLIPSNTGGTSGGATDRVLLNPNNTTYSNAFYFAEMYRNYNAHSSSYENLSSFRLNYSIPHNFAIIRNLTVYKSITGFGDNYGYPDAYPVTVTFSSVWRNTSTPWTSLGTVIFPQNTSGYILIQRIL